MKEKLQQYALVAEIISAIAIVLSLIFVGFQVKLGTEETAANSSAIRSQVQESMLDSDLQLLKLNFDYPFMVSADYMEGEMSLDDKGKWVAWLWMLIRQRENYWTQYQNGILDDETYNIYQNVLVLNLAADESAMNVWINSEAMGLYKKGFVDDINARLDAYLNDHSEELNFDWGFGLESIYGESAVKSPD